MLSTLPSPRHDVSLSNHQPYLGPHNSIADSDLSLENRLCPGCKQSAVSENGGLVVAFGQSFFHVECFKCAKCGDQVTADTNLLLLSDGSPICANCSYSCNICRLPILDEAIMTGDDSYHAHCFKCKVCNTRIDELVFAKTTQGIYCMNCHNERMAKMRRHAQKKAERAEREKREKERALADGSGSSRTYVNGSVSTLGSLSVSISAIPTSPQSPQNGSYSPIPSPNTAPPTPSKYAASPHPPKNALPGTGDALAHGTRPILPWLGATSPSQSSVPQHSLLLGTAFPQSQHGLPKASRDIRPSTAGVPGDPFRDKKNQLLSAGHPDPGLQRRKSFDDGVRSANPPQKPNTGFLQKPSVGSGVAAGLNIPSPATSINNKRRSINPGGMPFSLDTSLSVSPPKSSSPASVTTFGRPHGKDSPRVRSPLAEQFPEGSTTRPTSRGDSQRNSPSPALHTSSPPLLLNGEPGSSQDPLRTRSGSAGGHQADNNQASHSPRERIVDSGPARSASLGMSGKPASRGSIDGEGPSVSRAGKRAATDDHFSPSRGQRRASHQGPDGLRARGSPIPSDSRPNSPAHRADVPRNIESGTDTEAESEGGNKSPDDDYPAPLPMQPKALQNGRRPLQLKLRNENNVDISRVDSGDGSDLEDNSPGYERMSHPTFIAPALPPIRFSLSGSDFSEMLGGTGGPSLKSLDQLAMVSEKGEAELEVPPSPSGAPTPTMETTFGRSASVRAARDDQKTVAWSPDPVNMASFPEGKASSQDGHPTHASHSSLTLSPSHHTLPKRSNTVSVRPPSKLDDSFPSRSGRIDLSLSPGRGRATSDSANGMESSSHYSLSVAHSHKPGTRITLTGPDSMIARQLRQDASDAIKRRLREVLLDASERASLQVKLDSSFVETLLSVMDQREKEYNTLREEFDGEKRASRQYIDGLSVAQTEYDRELKARRDAEAEVTRLRVLLAGQAARLTTMSGETTRNELRQQMSKELCDTLGNLEQDIARLRVERDMTLAEVEELISAKTVNTAEVAAAKLGRSLMMRLDNIKAQYLNELLPLSQQREALSREIAELKGVRDVFLEETTVLNARNEELAKLSALYTRRMETVMPETAAAQTPPKQSNSFDRPRQQQPPLLSVSASLSTSTSTLSDERTEARANKPSLDAPSMKPKFIKWPGSKTKEPNALNDNARAKVVTIEHAFQHVNVLRFTRCDHCGDKLWGSQLRCSGCTMSVHARCSGHVSVSCTQQSTLNGDNPINMPPSMFGRDLTDQVRADAQGSDRMVPVIVEKCIEAVEASSLEYEGIYRKTGGLGQTKAITQLFERGDYAAFELRDSDRFNDICSVTSVLKTYLRSLPVPLLTYDLHDGFISAAEIKDLPMKTKALSDLVRKLPTEHYYTLRVLMLHLNRIRERCEKNLMNARNLGVVFGPTLMRSPDPSAEFVDMAGKALCIEWLVTNASTLFSPTLPPS